METLSAAAMRELDRRTIASGIKTGTELMENAGKAAAAAVKAMLPPAGNAGTPPEIAVLCGKGNNGGDGLVVARELASAGAAVRLFTVCSLAEYQGDAGLMAEKLPEKLKTEVRRTLNPGDLAGADIMVDALLGTGFRGGLREPCGRWIALINAARGESRGKQKVIAVDLPSGLNADSGEVGENAVRADVTVTFHRAKTGMMLARGPEYCGEIRVADIGIKEDGGTAAG